MTADKTLSLEEIRTTIDRIDGRLLALLGERMAAVEAVRRVKERDERPPVTAMRPAREAAILRRLVAERPDNVPADLVLRIWYEIIASATRMQVPLRVHLDTHGAGAVPLEIIHERFGVAVPVDLHGSCLEAVRAIGPECADVAVVGLADDGEDWVSEVAAMGSVRPRVIAILPFLGGEPDCRALVLGHAPVEASGDDTTVIAVLPAGRQPGKSVAALEQDLPVLGGAGRWRLAGASGLIAEESPLVEALRSDAAFAAVEIVGTFANPISLPRQV